MVEYRILNKRFFFKNKQVKKVNQSSLFLTWRIFLLFRNKSRFKFFILVTAQIFINLLDVLGVAIFGILYLSASGGVFPDAGPLTLILNALKIGETQESLSVLALFTLLIFVAKTLLTVWFTKCTLTFLRQEAIGITKNALLTFFDQTIDRVQAQSSQKTSLSFGYGMTCAVVERLAAASLMISEITLMLFLGVFLIVIDLPTTVASMIYFAVVVIVLQKFLSKRILKVGNLRLQGDIKSGTLLQELVTNFREVYSSRKLSHFLKQYLTSRSETLTNHARLNLFNLLPKYFLELALVGAITLLFLVTDFSDGGASTIAFFLAAGSRLLPSLIRINATMNTSKSQLSTASLASQLIDTLMNCKYEVEHSVESEDTTNDSPLVVFNEVSFRHSNRPNLVLDQVSFLIYQHEFIGIVGKSGAGKSTIFDLILGLLNPTIGKITIAKGSPQLIHHLGIPRIALVSQNTGMFNGTLRMNLTLESELDVISNDEVIWNALKFAKLEEFVRNLPDGLETELGEFGSKLSGGQKQRLGIARAFMLEPEILLLDEATSSLDSESEEVISQMIEVLREKVTIISIAHRLSFIRKADRILYFDEGKLIDEGNFDELLITCPAFKNQAILLGINNI